MGGVAPPPHSPPATDANVQARRSANPASPRPRSARRRKWVVFCRSCKEGSGNVLRYLARYVFAGPMRGRTLTPLADDRLRLEYTDNQSSIDVYTNERLTIEEI